MMHADDEAKLADYEEEEIEDIVLKLAKVFHIQFGKEAFKGVDNFEQFCDVIENSIKYNHQESCTKQQAFYKIREAVSSTLLINRAQIKPDSNLADLFPKQNRRKQVKEFYERLGIKLNLLTYPDWLAILFFIGFVASFIAFFFDWKIAVFGIVVFVLTTKVADYFG